MLSDNSSLNYIQIRIDNYCFYLAYQFTHSLSTLLKRIQIDVAIHQVLPMLDLCVNHLDKPLQQYLIKILCVPLLLKTELTIRLILIEQYWSIIILPLLIIYDLFL